MVSFINFKNDTILYLCEMKTTLCRISVFLFVLLILSIPNFAQDGILKGRVADHQSEEALPYVSVSFVKAKRGVLSDSAGFFNIPFSFYGKEDSLFIQSVGYNPLYIPLTKLTSNNLGTVHLFVQAFKQEAVVKSKYNRALWFWKKIMSKKYKNNPANFTNYSYEVYNKMEVDLNNVQKDKLAKSNLIKPIEFVFDYIDTAENHKAFLPVYITETISDYYNQNDPRKTLEVIKKTRTNGLENESIIKELGGAYQNINVYKNVIPVFNKEFISPLHTNADAYYNFKLADTAYLNGKRLVHLLFKPKGINELTFEGDCWVNDTSFAIQKITLRPSTFADINFLEALTMIQEFKLVNDTTWFLAKDRFVADFSPKKGGLGIKGRKTTTYKNISINDTTIAARLDEIERSPKVELLDKSSSNNEAEWQALRHEPLGKTEKAVYAVLDTLNKNKTFLLYKNAAEFLVKGIKEVGNYTFGPWFNVLSSNKWEGTRIRLDLATNLGFSKKWNFYGYGAYGFLDQKAKGKLGATYRFKKSPLMYMQLEHKSDLEFGQEYFDQINNDNLFGTLLRRPNIPFRFQELQQTQFKFFHENNHGFQFTWAFADKQFNPLLNLPKIAENNGNIAPMHAVEASFGIRFAYQERYLESNFSRFGFGSVYPVVELKFAHSYKGVLNSGADYEKLNFTLNDELPITPFGNIVYSIYVGKTWGRAAYSFLDIMPGNEMMYYNKYAFNLMRRYEFLSDGYIGMNLEHKLGKGILKYIPFVKKTKWRQFWNTKAVIGELSSENKEYNFIGNHSFNSLASKPYYEIGTGIENIARFFRVDFVWRVKDEQVKTATASSFGIFGSFRVSL
jgi:hypothetical protein